MKEHLRDYTFDELVEYHAGRILLAMMKGDFYSAVWFAMYQSQQMMLDKQQAAKKEAK